MYTKMINIYRHVIKTEEEALGKIRIRWNCRLGKSSPQTGHISDELEQFSNFDLDLRWIVEPRVAKSSSGSAGVHSGPSNELWAAGCDATELTVTAARRTVFWWDEGEFARQGRKF